MPSGYFWVTLVLIIIIILLLITSIVGGTIAAHDAKAQITALENDIQGVINAINNSNISSSSPSSVIDYGNNLPTALPPNAPFDPVFSTFMARCCMSAYNRSLNGSLLLPPTLILVQTVGDYGILLQRVANPGQKNLYILAFRGTDDVTDIEQDLNIVQTPFIDLAGTTYNKALVHKRFFEIWTAMKPELSSILATLTSNDSIAITGHSLGTGLAYMTSLAFALQNPTLDQGVFALAPPRPGNGNFMSMLELRVFLRWSVVNQTDVIPTLPPSVTPVFGSTYFYDQLDNTAIIDIESVGLVDNHSIGTYVCGLNNFTAPECPATIIWSSPVRVIDNL